MEADGHATTGVSSLERERDRDRRNSHPLRSGRAWPSGQRRADGWASVEDACDVGCDSCTRGCIDGRVQPPLFSEKRTQREIVRCRTVELSHSCLREARKELGRGRKTVQVRQPLGRDGQPTRSKRTTCHTTQHDARMASRAGDLPALGHRARFAARGEGRSWRTRRRRGASKHVQAEGTSRCAALLSSPPRPWTFRPLVRVASFPARSLLDPSQTVAAPMHVSVHIRGNRRG